MPRIPPEEKLQRLETEKSQLQARIDKTRAQVRVQERKQDTRRKIIAGALALEHAKTNPAFGKELDSLIAKYVTKEEDRRLFDLKP